jgi:hypothetical protein
LFVPFILQVFTYCSIFGCDDASTFYYEVGDINVYHLDNSGPSAIVAQTDQVTKSAYGIRVSLDRNKIAMRDAFTPSMFFPVAMATSCADDEYLAADTIAHMKVFTLEDFDDIHAAGSDVSTYFRIGNLQGYTALDDYVNMYGAERLYNGNLHTELDLLLMTAPELGTAHQFSVEIALTDGRVIQKTTTTINLIE